MCRKISFVACPKLNVQKYSSFKGKEAKKIGKGLEFK